MLIMAPYILREYYGKAVSQPLYEAEYEVDEDRRRPHGGKRPLSYRLADYYGVGKGIEELEQIASDHRKREAKQHGKRISLSQIDCHITPSWPRHACALCS